MVGLILWLTTKVGNIAIIFSIIADGLAAMPTLKKSYYFPKTETIWSYLSAAIYAGITLLTVKTWNFPNYAFSLYILIIDLSLVALIMFDFKKFLKRS